MHLALHYLLAALAAAAVRATAPALSALSPPRDWRELQSGALMLRDAYLDQPYCIVLSSGDRRWLCTITRNSGGAEGHSGEHVEVLWSVDRGGTWTSGVRLEDPTAPTNAYSTIVEGAGGRVYTLYNMNVDRVSKLPSGVNLTRDDELGYFVMRYSDDGGATWSAARYDVPYPLTTVDAHNSFNGTVRMMWSVDQVKVRGGRTYHAFTSIGKYSQSPPEAAFLLSSPNLLTETDPAAITWDLLPGSADGVFAPNQSTVSFEEAHVVPLLDSPGFYMVARTSMGYLAAASTADPSGLGGWTLPAGYATYWSALASGAGRRLKNPQGPITLKRFDTHGGRYLLLSYFNSFGGYGATSRNPYWLSAGVEEEGGVRFSQPEVVLYDFRAQSGVVPQRPGYPDFIEEADGTVYVTETNKTDARVHLVDARLLALLFAQDTVGVVAQGGLALTFTNASAGRTFPTPPLFDFSAYTGSGMGVTLGLWLSGHASSQPGQVLIDVASLTLSVAAGGALHVLLVDTHAQHTANATMDAECAARLVAGDGAHYASVVVDGGAHLLTFAVDGAVCDGSVEAVAGWAWVPVDMGDLSASATASFVLGEGSGGAYGGRVEGGQWYARALANSEVVGNWRAGV